MQCASFWCGCTGGGGNRIGNSVPFAGDLLPLRTKHRSRRFCSYSGQQDFTVRGPCSGKLFLLLSFINIVGMVPNIFFGWGGGERETETMATLKDAHSVMICLSAAQNGCPTVTFRKCQDKNSEGQNLESNSRHVQSFGFSFVSSSSFHVILLEKWFFCDNEIKKSLSALLICKKKKIKLSNCEKMS